MRSNYKMLGDYIELVSRTNSDLKYGMEDVRGCSNTKQMVRTKTNLIGRTYDKFIVLKPEEFVFNRRTTRNGERIGMAYNNTQREYIFTNDYVAFRVKPECLDILLPEYLYLFFCRDEFDRYARYKSTGSATEFFNWEDMCAVPFTAPQIDFQKQIVKIYQTLTNRIALKRKINENLTEIANALFYKYFIENEKQETWEEGSFSHMLIDVIGGDWGQETPSGNYVYQVSCIRGADIPALNHGSISNAPTRFILEKNFNVKKICPNNMVVEISGGSPVQATGRIALISEQILSYRGNNMICSNFCRVLKVDENYLYFFLQNWLYLYRNGVMFNYENSSTGLKNFDLKSFVESYAIRIPPKELSIKFNNLIRPIYKEIFNIGFEVENLQNALDHIIPHIILGNN